MGCNKPISGETVVLLCMKSRVNGITVALNRAPRRPRPSSANVYLLTPAEQRPPESASHFHHNGSAGTGQTALRTGEEREGPGDSGRWNNQERGSGPSEEWTRITC